MAEINFFATTNFRNERRKFGIKTDDLRRHMYLLGKTGMGKSTMIENMVIQDIQAGHGVALLDPHGESAVRVLDYVPASRINDVIYFNPADLEYPIAFNIIESVNPEYKHLVASGLMSVFKKIFANLWSARMEYILNNSILALLDSPGNTLLGINRLFTDKEFRRKIVGRVKDPVVKSFWVNEFAAFSTQFRVEAIAAIQNKVGQFLSSSIIRNIVGQTKSTIDLREVMDNQKILIMDLSKGKVGEDNSALLGAMMVTRLQLAAMSRVDIPESERKDFYLYVDEFQNFATESFATILSEARKYRLSLVMGHQYIAQLDEHVRDSIFGNVGTIVLFRVGAPDAQFLVKEFEPYFTEEHLVNLAKYEIYLKLMIDGISSRPFSATTLPPLSFPSTPGVREKVMKVSRERYGKPRAIVEDKIRRWLDVDVLVEEEKENTGGNKNQSALKGDMPQGKKDVRNLGVESKATEIGNFEITDHPTYQLLCDSCGQKVVINFDPDPKKFIFCRECLKKYWKGEIRDIDLVSKNKEFFELVRKGEEKKKINFLAPKEQIIIEDTIQNDDDEEEGFVKLSDLSKLRSKFRA